MQNPEHALYQERWNVLDQTSADVAACGATLLAMAEKDGGGPEVVNVLLQEMERTMSRR